MGFQIVFHLGSIVGYTSRINESHHDGERQKVRGAHPTGLFPLPIVGAYHQKRFTPAACDLERHVAIHNLLDIGF